MDRLDEKVAVVTGAASGIGRAVAHALLGEGMKVVLADIEAPALARTATELADAGELLAVTCDVSDPDAVDTLRDAALERFGAVHVVMNNAGVSTGGPVWSHTPADWEWVLGVNLMGVVNGVRSFTPLMIEQGEGHIVNTASMAGLSSPPFMAVYNVSKHAVVALSETLFGDLALVGATGVGVSVLCPGWVQTRIHEAARNRPDDGTSGAAASDAGGAESGEDSARAGFAELAASLIAGGINPDDVAAQVVDAIRSRRFYVLTHPEWVPMVTGRVERIAAGEDPLVVGLPADD